MTVSLLLEKLRTAFSTATIQSWQKLAPIEEIYADSAEPHSQVVISVALLFDTSCSTDSVPLELTQRIAKGHPRFSSRLVTNANGKRIFETQDFDAEEYITRHRIGEKDEGDLEGWRKKRFDRIVGKLMERNLDESRLWELHWIEGFGAGEDGEGVSAFVRVHHCVADGMALIEYFTNCCVDQVEMREEGKVIRSVKSKGKEISKRGKAQGTLTQIVSALYQFLALVLLFIKGVLTILTVFMRDKETVLTRGPVTERRVVTVKESKPNFVSELKLAAKKHNGTINDLIMTAVSGAVRRYLMYRGEDVVRLKNLTTGIAFNRRALHSRDFDIDNQHAVTFMTIPVDKKISEQRYADMKERLDELKRGFVVSLTIACIWLLEKLDVRLRRMIWHRFSGRLSLVVSNLKGPQTELVVAGAPVKAIWPFAPLDGQCTLVGTVFSYNGKVAVSFTSDANRVPDPEKLLEYYNKELDALLF